MTVFITRVDLSIMAITENQRKQRIHGIGASECAAVLGLDPWRSAWDIWAIKTGKIEEPDGDSSEAQKIGNIIEPTIAELASMRLGCKLVKPKNTYKADNGVMFANLDRQVERAAKGSPNVELKSTALVDGWGEEGTDDVPERVYVQVHAQMLCSASDISHVARLLGRHGFSFSMYVVPLNRELAEIIEERVCDFWHKHVVKDIPPSDSPPSIEIASALRRVSGKSVEIAYDIVSRFVDARNRRIEAEAAESAAKAALLAAMSDAEVGVADGYEVSFKTVSRRLLDSDRLKREKPDVFSEYQKVVSYRRLNAKEKGV